jgi:pterin-4a-carbinolamine dehydratase
MSQQWRERNRPARLERRYEFDSYDELRDFLDQAAELSESEGLYPDMGFGRDYVNITIHAEEDQNTMQDSQRQFAERLDGLCKDVPGARA